MQIKFENLVKKEYQKVFEEYVDLKGISDQWYILANLASLDCLVDEWEEILDALLKEKMGVHFKIEDPEEAKQLRCSEEYTQEQGDGKAHLTLPASNRTGKEVAMILFENVSKIYYILPYMRKDFKPDIRLLTDIILSDAKRLNSTDIHFTIESDLEGNFNYEVKFRRGIYLQKQSKYNITKAILDRIISDMLINRSSVGQKHAEMGVLSGIRFRLTDERFPARCQIATSIGGNTLTTRMFDFKKAPTIQQLGFNKNTQDMLTRTSGTYSGLTLVSGVFGSGKGTTLNSVGMLMEEKGRLAIASLDDPIEYLRKYNQYEYASQKQLQEYVDAFKKMDLNVVFLNEIITKMTAEAVFDLVSAGVHVLSTIHTDRVFRVMYKLEDLLGRKYLNLIPFLNVISYQDKFSITCKECNTGVAKENYPKGSDEERLLTFLGLNTIRQPQGCSNCEEGIDYRGIKVVSEHIEFNDTIKADLLKLDLHEQFDYLKELTAKGENLEAVVKEALSNGEILISEALKKLDTWR